MTRVLILDADAEQARSLSRVFAKARPDITILTVRNASAATRLMGEEAVDLLLAGLQATGPDSLELVAWAHEHSPETEIFTMAEPGVIDPQDKRLNGAAGQHFEKPLDEQHVVTRMCDALNQSVRGHLDNVSLASLLQLLEMERKSCTLGVTCGKRQGWLVVSKGVLIGAMTDELQGEAAAIAIVAWPGATITISRRPVETGVEIQSSLGFILIEAMRLVDEAARRGTKEASGSGWPIPRRTWRPTQKPQTGVTFESTRPPGELGLPGGASGLALVETSTGNVLRSAAREDCPIGDLARLASQLLLQEAATLRLCGDAEGVEELVLSTTSRCDVIRPLSPTEFALLVFVPEETNLVIARLELDHFIAVEQATRSS